MAEANVGSILVMKSDSLRKSEVEGLITERWVPFLFKFRTFVCLTVCAHARKSEVQGLNTERGASA